MPSTGFRSSNTARLVGRVAILGATLLVCCIAVTQDATDVTSTSATLNATGLCESGSCDYFYRYWPAALGPSFGRSTALRSPSGMPPNTVSPIPEPVTNLVPDTTYRFTICGKEAHESSFTCAGDKELTTLPPPEIPTFSASFEPPNIVTLRWATSGALPDQPLHIYGRWHDRSNGTYYQNIGFRSERQKPNGLRFRVYAGRNRYTLSVPTANGEVTRSVEVDVPPPPSPAVDERVIYLYSELLADTTVSWSNPQEGHFVQIRRFGHEDQFTTPPGASSYTFPKAYLESLGQGSHRFDLHTCLSMTGLTPRMNNPFCSERTRIDLEIGGAKFLGPRRIHVPTGGSAEVSWTPTGQFAVLDAPSLGIEGELIVGTSRLFENLPDGVHDIRVTSCTAYPATCAHLTAVAAPATGTLVDVRERSDFYGGTPQAGQLLARIQVGETYVPVVAPVKGYLQYTYAEEGAHVTENQPLFSLRTGQYDHMQLVVESPTFEVRDWSEGYPESTAVVHEIPTYRDFVAGNMMPVLASQDGNVWVGGEFSDGNVLQISGDATSGFHITPFLGPRLYKPTANGARLEAVRPFARGAPFNSLTKQELIIEAGQYIWFISGGSPIDYGIPDWNRIVRVDRQAVDLHTTPYDDRMCVFHVPFDGANVMGVAWDEAAGLIWYVESRKPKGGPGGLGWFDPDEIPCENFLDYSDPEVIANAATQYCTSPEQSGCIHTVPLVDSLDSSKYLKWAAHVAVDADAVWVAGFYVSQLARYDRAAGTVSILPAPESSGFARLVGTGVWHIVSLPDYLYFSEFFDGDVVRLDKQMLAADPASCRELVDGANPCMSEIHAGAEIKDLRIHGDRLYFAGIDGFGYIDLSTWTPGGIYTGLERLRSEERARRGPLMASDMSIGPDGMVVLSDYSSAVVFRLYPATP